MVFMGVGMETDMSVFTLFTKVSCWAQSSLSLASLANQLVLAVFCFHVPNAGIIGGPPYPSSFNVVLGFEL